MSEDISQSEKQKQISHVNPRGNLENGIRNYLQGRHRERTCGDREWGRGGETRTVTLVQALLFVQNRQLVGYVGHRDFTTFYDNLGGVGMVEEGG